MCQGFHGGSDDKESACGAGDLGFNPWVRKIPWRSEWLLTPLFLPGEFHGQRSLADYSPWGHKESDMTEQLTLSPPLCLLLLFLLFITSILFLDPILKG